MKTFLFSIRLAMWSAIHPPSHVFHLQARSFFCYQTYAQALQGDEESLQRQAVQRCGRATPIRVSELHATTESGPSLVLEGDYGCVAHQIN